MIFFTADLHFGHANIIKLCKRPFRDVQHMNTALINRWNERVKPEDTVYHLGDFCFTGRGSGSPAYPRAYERLLNGTIVHILGNHDRGNRIRNSIYYAEIKFGKRVWHLQHKPPLDPLPDHNYLVGHVHEKWDAKLNGEGIIINVGVDVFNFYPVKPYEILRFADKFRRDNVK